ncbi:cell division ATP-binding protein FtsE [Parvularcula dongshanensis]|uniref:Cell division ATP-binding protein FtsE n=1 Tax=Parvularcula dongshanensis TaxID=1173995 RepID=A0A840I2T2_9PROT|nr:cell division ATP-binding protein FtsE [Parvularcula dongshanensis]MBB4658591.1 cell division transport system ATP-binding protein [Parvularcula dongshanensis]
MTDTTDTLERAPDSPQAAPGRDVIVRLEDVGLTYDGTREVLRGASLTLREGDFRFLTGPSGAGKTTLLKLIYLAHKPTTGQVRVFGEDVATLPPGAMPGLRRRIGVVFQEFRLLDHLTAFENVALPMRVAGVNHQGYAGDVIDLLSWVGLSHRIDAKPPVLSGGEKQRVALARALVSKPDLILADEPTGNVDPVMGEKIMRLLIELNRLGTAVIVATHDLGLVRRLGKNILRLKDGRVTLHGPLPEKTDGEERP